MMGDIYPSHVSLQERKRAFFKCQGISDTDKALVREFIHRQEGLGVGERRVTKILSNLKTILTVVSPGFSLGKATEKDILKLGSDIKSTHHSDRM